jgi:hypothetical protein
MDMLQGVDISKYQGIIDWAKMQAKKEAGVLQFVIIRAGSIDNVTGVCYEDYQFDANVAGAKAAGIPYAFYWFFRPNWSAKTQADYFLATVAGKYSQPPTVDLWCDIEVAGQASAVQTFCKLCDQKAATGIYTSPGKLAGLTGDKTGLAAFPLWLADWTPPANVPLPWKEYLIWQYGVKPDGKDYGCESISLDHNQAVDSFLRPITPTPPPSDLVARVTALEEKVNIIDGEQDSLLMRVTVLEKVNKIYDLNFADIKRRLDALEARPPATISASFKMLARTPARCITHYNDAGKPIFEIYPRDSSETKDRIYLENTIQVFPYAMTGDGARKAYPVYKAAPQQLYVYVEDGTLQ